MKPFKSALNLEQGGHISVPRNSFDMGYHTMFTSPAGMLLPTYVQDVQPDDYLNLNVANFTRTMPVNTAAFSRMKEITKFYFVPYRLLWQNFNQFYTGVSDIATAYTPQTGIPSTLPYLTIDNIITVLESTGLDNFLLPKAKFAERLLDLCGFPVSNDSSVTTLQMYKNIRTYNASNSIPQPVFNPFRLLAYQRIFFDFYRNTDYTANEPRYYNIDNFAGGTAIDFPTAGYIFEPRYSLWHKDRITSVKPSPLVVMQDRSAVGATNGEGLGTPDEYLARDSGATSYGVPTSSSYANINIARLRATMAYDRLARLTMLSPKTYEAQLKAQFGVTPDNCDYCSVRYLGSYDSTINIGEVTASAAGETGTGSKSVLGQLAGKGISSDERNGVIKAHFNEPGIVMGIHQIQPYSEYDSNRLDDFNKKINRNDYYMPSYDNLGLQPLLRGQVNIPTSGDVTLNHVVGYQARYLEYKTRVDEVHGQFQSKQSLSAWCMPRTAQIESGIIGSSNMYVNPKITDTLFALSYDGSQQSDPFMCHYRYDATIVRNMSMLGIPTM